MTLFAKTDVDLPFDIEGGFTATDVAGMTIQLVKGDFTLEKTLGAGIVQNGSEFILSLARTEILTTGDYNVYVRITDQGGKQRGISVIPKKLTFDKFPINA